MSVQVEKLEKSMVKMTIELAADSFEAAVEKAYQKNKNKIQVPGFRKGKAPRKLIEKTYGVGVFYEDAANILINESYPSAVEEAGVKVVAQPEIDIVDLGADKAFVYTATVAVRPEVTLGEYKGIAVTKYVSEATEQEVMEEITKEQKRNATVETVTDRAVEDGDIVTIDFEGFVDGVAFEGGKGEDYDLTIGSHSFIDTFETQLIGSNIGDDVDVNVTFPAEYQAEELAGKPALFKVKVKKIAMEMLPEIDDEFASEVSSFDTLEEYKNSIKAKIDEKKATESTENAKQAAVDKAVENATMEIPDAMVEEEVKRRIQDFAQRLSMQGLSFDQYMQYTGGTLDQMKETLRPQAFNQVSTRLVLEDIAKAENFEITEEDTDAEFARIAAQYNMDVNTVKDYFAGQDLEGLKLDIAVQKAVEFIYDNAVVTEEKKED